MTNARRMELENRILDLTEAMDAAGTPAEKEALLVQIEALEATVRDIDLADADALGDKIDTILGELEKIQNERPLDAGSALKRSIDGLRDMRRRL